MSIKVGTGGTGDAGFKLGLFPNVFDAESGNKIDAINILNDYGINEPSWLQQYQDDADEGNPSSVLLLYTLDGTATATYVQYNGSTQGWRDLSTAKGLRGLKGDTGESIISAEIQGDDVVFVKSDGTFVIVENLAKPAEFSEIQGSPYDNSELAQALNDKQSMLVSGINIKTINNINLLGSGNIEISGGGGEGTTEHNLLTNRNLPDQHEIDAITGLRDELNQKVNTETGKGLTDENYTLAEKTKLANIEAEATKNQPDSFLIDRGNHEGTQPISSVTDLESTLNNKVNTVPGRGLSEQNFTLTEKVKLSNIEAEATKNQPDSFLIDRGNHAGTQPISSVTNLQSTLDNKVDAVAGKVLSDQNFTLTEKVKLSNIETEATKNQPDNFLLDRSNHVGAIAIVDVDNLQSSLDNKVNTTDSRLSDAREWIAEEVSLEEAQARTSGTFKKWSALRVGQSIIAWWQSTGNQAIIDDLITSEDLNTALNGKVDKVTGFGLSETNFTQAEKDKLASLEDVKFKGLFETVEALEAAYPTADPGSYAFIDGTAGNPNQLYVWATDKWEIVGGEIVSLTPAQVKQLLLENADTNNFGDAEKQKLEDALTQTELANALTGYAQLVHNHTISQITGLQSELDGKAASEHTHEINQIVGLVTALNEKSSVDHDHTIDDVVGLQTALDGKAANIHTHQINQIDGLADSLDSKVDKEDGKGLSSNDYTTIEKNKLDSIESNATANATDAQLRDRTTHTGTQAISTVTGLQTVLNDKVDKEDGKGLSSNDYTTIEKNKLAGISNNATVNSTDAQLRDRTTHTGTQAISTVTGLQTALDSKVDKVSGKGLSTNDYDNSAKSKVDSMGTAASRDATVSAIDLTSGRLLKVGDWGLTGKAVLPPSGSSSLTLQNNGVYSDISGGILDTPDNWGILTSYFRGDVNHRGYQFYCSQRSNLTQLKLYAQAFTGSAESAEEPTVTGWKEIYHTGNLGDSDTAWTTVTSLENGWTGTIRYIIRGGMVTVAVEILNGANATNNTVLTLPTRYRPNGMSVRGVFSRGDADECNRVIIGSQLTIVGDRSTMHQGSITYPVLS